MRGSTIGARNRALWGCFVLTGALAMASGCKTDGKDKATPELGNEVGSSKVKLPEEKAATNDPVVPATPAPLPALEGEHFTAFDMLVNRPLAHRLERRDGRSVAALSAEGKDFIRYINGNYPSDWNTDLELDEEKAAGIKGRKGSVWFPSFDTDDDQALLLRVHNPARGDNSLTLTLNDKELDPIKLAKGWQTLRVKLPAGLARAENRLDFNFSNMGRYEKKLAGGALGWLRLGPASALPEPPKVAEAVLEEGARAEGEGAQAKGASDASDSSGGPEKAADSAALGAPHHLPLAQDALALAPGQGIVWHMWAIPKSKIELAIKADIGCGPAIKISTEAAGGGKLSTALQEKRLLVEGRGDTQTTALDLTNMAGEEGQVVRVELWADEACKVPLTLQTARLAVPGKMPARKEVAPPKYVLFWMIDTLRADHLPFYNKDTNVEAPALTKLAEEGAVFHVAYVQGNESKVSHASLFSAMYPSRHRVLARGNLKPHHEIMPEAMKKLGYRTGAHISNGYISEPWGFAQGWDHFVNNLRDGWRIDGMSMAGHAIKWATENKDKPFFLYVGTIDPHVTYRRHEDFIDKYDEPGYSGRYRKYCSGEDLGKIKGGSLKVNERDRLRIQNLYKNEISFNDSAFAKVRASFEEMGIWDETMVVITADHGDEFWEHGGVGHGHNVHQELVHVPLLMYYKPLIEEGTNIHSGADVLDVYPTLVDVAGGERPEGLQGKSLVPELIGQHGGYPAPAIATRYLGHYGVQLRHFKLYLRKGEFQVYNRHSDPLEKTNASSEHPLATRWLLDSAGWFRSNRKEWDKTTWGVASNLSPKFLEVQAEASKK